MTKEHSSILRGDERLWDVALRGIGISLPDEYILRFTRLLYEASQGGKGLANITLDNLCEIEQNAREDFVERMKADEED